MTIKNNREVKAILKKKSSGSYVEEHNGLFTMVEMEGFYILCRLRNVTASATFFTSLSVLDFWILVLQCGGADHA